MSNLRIDKVDMILEIGINVNEFIIIEVLSVK